MRRTTLIGVVVGILLIAGLAVDQLAPESTRATSIATDPGGLRGAALLAEDAGVPVESLRKPWTALPEDSPGRGVLVVTLPLAQSVTPLEQGELADWLAAGNSVVLLSSGERTDLPGWMTQAPFYWTMGAVEEPELAGPSDWWTIQALHAEGGGPAAALPRATHVFLPHDDDIVAFSAADGPAVRRRAHLGGEVWLVDGPLLHNRWLPRSPAHAEWWQDRLARADRVWFDDVHQGLVDLDAVDATGSTWSARALFLHLCGLWLMGVWAVARPFGTRTSPPPPPRSSVARELDDLARIHAHHKHAAGAIAQLHASADGPGPLPPSPDTPSDHTLLDTAQAIARLQARGRLS